MPDIDQKHAKKPPTSTSTIVRTSTMPSKRKQAARSVRKAFGHDDKDKDWFPGLKQLISGPDLGEKIAEDLKKKKKRGGR